MQIVSSEGRFTGHDHPADTGVRSGGLDALIQTFDAENGFQSGVIDLVHDLGRSVERVDGHHHCTGFQDGKIGQHEFRAVGHANSDPFAFADAETAQPRRHPVCLIGNLLVGAGFTLVDQADAFRAQPGGFVQEVKDWHFGVIKMCWHTGIIMR